VCTARDFARNNSDTSVFPRFNVLAEGTGHRLPFETAVVFLPFPVPDIRDVRNSVGKRTRNDNIGSQRVTGNTKQRLREHDDAVDDDALLDVRYPVCDAFELYETNRKPYVGLRVLRYATMRDRHVHRVSGSEQRLDNHFLATRRLESFGGLPDRCPLLLSSAARENLELPVGSDLCVVVRDTVGCKDQNDLRDSSVATVRNVFAATGIHRQHM